MDQKVTRICRLKLELFSVPGRSSIGTGLAKLANEPQATNGVDYESDF
jgi:hypothetical protein